MCESARAGLSACSAFSTSAEYCADAACTAAIMNVEGAWSQCQNDPALAPIWDDLAGICAPSDCSGVTAPLWVDNMLNGIASGNTLSTVQLVGGATVDGDRGIALDGDGDYIMIATGGSAPLDYAADGEFSVGLWFSRSSECNSNQDWEFLWSQSLLPEGGATNSTNMHISVICDSTMTNADGSAVLSRSGTVVTTFLVDDSGQFAQFDWSLAREAPKLEAITSEWTHMVLTVSSNSIKVFADGTAVGMYGYHIWDQAMVVDNNPANPDPTVLKTPMTTFAMGNSPVYLGSYEPGADSWWAGANFPGNMAGLAIYGTAVDLTTAACAFQSGSQAVGTCPLPNTITGAVWFGDFLDGITPPGAATIGNAALDPEFGITVDGSGDYVTVNAPAYADDATFSVSFWFTRQGECNIDNRMEFLFSQIAGPPTGRIPAPETAGIYIGLVCAGQTRMTENTGDQIRVMLVDAYGTRGAFNTELITPSDGGLVAQQWVHVVLTVSADSYKLYLDGVGQTATSGSSQLDALTQTASVTPIVTAVAAGGSGHPSGYTTLLLEVDLPAESYNVYAMSGTTGAPLMFASAYQVSVPFGANIGGTNPAFWAIANNAALGYVQYDSWLTLGVTDGTAAGAIVASPGFDISNWGWTDSETYDASRSLTTSNGAIFWMNPSAAPAGRSAIAQLTVASTAGTLATANFQGKSAPLDGGGQDWTANGVVFTMGGAAGGGGGRGGNPQMAWMEVPCTVAGDTTGCNNMIGGQLQVPFTSFSMPGRDIVLAGEASGWTQGDHMFFGSMAGVGLFSGPLTAMQIRCLNYYDSARVGVCAPLEGDWSIPFIGRSPLMRAVTYQGDASLDSKFGLQLDGEGDFATMPGIGFTDQGYQSGSYTVSLWFTKVNACNSETIDKFEYLFSTATSSSSTASGVNLMIACQGPNDPADPTLGAISTASGDVLRAWVVDTDGGVATLDYSLNFDPDGGAVTGNWAHVALVVTPGSMTFYIDGVEAPRAALGYALRFHGNWDGTSANKAVPDLGRSFLTDLSDYDFEETYSDFTDYNYTAVLEPWKNHTFHAMDTGSDGWHGGFWEVRTLDTDELLAGGRTDGQVTSFDTYTQFRTPNVQDAPCVFPFVYDGTTYNACTADWVVDGVVLDYGSQWCATTPEITQDNDGQWSPWGACVADDQVPVIAYGPGCTSDYRDFNTYTKTVPLKAGVMYYMHAGITGYGSWGTTAWKMVDQADETILIAGGPTASCCDANGQTATPFTVAADTTATFVLTTTQVSGSVIWAINTRPDPLAEWEWRSTLDAGNACGTPVIVKISTHRYAAELSWEIDGGSDDSRGRASRISGGLWHQAQGPRRADIYVGARVGARSTDRVTRWTFFTGSLAGIRIFPYPLQSDEANCLFRDGARTVQTCKAPADMPGTLIYASMTDGMAALPATVSLVGDTILDGAWGAVVDGQGDAVQISSIDYSQDSTFSIAFWFTKTACEVQGSFERLFSQQMDQESNWFSTTNNTNIHVLIGCQEFNDDGLSTLRGDVIRVIMIDDDGNRGTFDVALGSAKSGGVVEDAWVHFAMSVTPTGVIVFMDGRRIDSVSDRMHDSEHMRDLLGQTTMLGMGDGEDLTQASAKDQCGDYCRAQGYTFFGLQWTNQCYCDNDFGSFGEASETAADGYGACDIDNDGTPDCGYGQAGYPLSWYEDPSHNAAVGSTDPMGQTRKACGWRNAVYQIPADGASVDSVYQGCYLDGQAPTSCATATSCEMCALMGAPTALNPDGCGWSGRNGGSCRDGYSTSPWECAVSEYGFPADRRGGVSDESWWSWAQSNTNIFYPDPSSLRTEACSANTTDATLASSCAAVALGTDGSWANCAAVAGCVYQPEAMLGGFTMDEVYAPNSDNTITLDLDPSSIHIFQGTAVNGQGWQGGFWEVSADGVSIAGGPAMGLVNGAMGFGVIIVPATVTTVTLNIRAGAQNTNQIVWVIDPPTAGAGNAMPLYSGPRAGTITLGRTGDRKGYEGSFAGLSISRRPLDDDSADCLYKEGAGTLAVCEAADLIAGERRTTFYGSFVDGADELPNGVTLGDDAYLDRDFGVQVDGDEDYFAIETGQWYSASDRFSISFWFTKTSECDGAGSEEMQSLFSHNARPLTSDPWDDDNSNLNIQIGCSADGVGSSVQSGNAGGRTDILRFWLQDDSNNKAVFDVGLDSARGGGYVTDQWIHLAFSVSRTRFEVFLDGLPAQRYGFPTSWSDRGEDFAFSRRNKAWNRAYARNAAPGHNPFACLENGTPDADCCAGSGACTAGHTFSPSTEVCYTTNSGRQLFSSNCVPDGSTVTYTPPSRDGYRATDQYGGQTNDAYAGLPKNSDFGRFSNAGIYETNSEYTVEVPLHVGDHTFTPFDSRNENWSGGTWWITEVVPDDACGGGVQCDGAGDGPCSCDPCDACNANELARGGVAEDLLQDIPQTFTIPPADQVISAFGPGCRYRDRYQDFGEYHSLVTLEAGMYYMHTGSIWDGGEYNPCGSGVQCDGAGDGPCSCDPCAACSAPAPPPSPASYWTVYNNVTGAIVAGGPGSGNAGPRDEGITPLNLLSTGLYDVVVTTFQISSIEWAITSDFVLLGDDMRNCQTDQYTLHIQTGEQRAWSISWEIDGGDNPDSYNDDLYTGPHRRSIYMGGIPARDPDTRRRTNRDQYFEGSIAQVLLMNDPIDPMEADCLFRAGEANLGICPSIEEMYDGRDWLGTMMGSSENRIASRDLSGSRQSMSENWDTLRTLQGAVAQCSAICTTQGYAYMGLQWANECWCDNDYGSKGTAADANDAYPGTCSLDGVSDAAADVACGTGASNDVNNACGWRNAVYSLTADGELPDGTALPGDPAAPTYAGCYADQITPLGTTMFGDAQEDQEMSFGIMLDGAGDYLTIDPMSQCGDRRWNACTENYAADGKFTISFWFWKRACASPGAWEWLYSHQNNSAPINNEAAPDCLAGQASSVASPCSTWSTIPTVINSEAERLAWIASDPEVHGDDGSVIDQDCTECMDNFWSGGFRGNYTRQVPFLGPAQVYQTDDGPMMAGYPMSLCLDNAGHRQMDVHATVESFLNFKCNDPVFGDRTSDACSFKTWRRGTQATPADQRMRALFKLGNEIRSEADQSISGFNSIQISNDLVPNANINMFLGCSEHGESSSLSGDVIRTMLVDDDSNRATFDWSLDSARSGGFATNSWVHVALTVDGSRVRTFVDGAEIGAESYGYDNLNPNAAWTSVDTTVQDLAMYQAWRLFESQQPGSDVQSNITDGRGAQCWECWGASLRGDGGMTGGYDETQFVFPMYLALNINDPGLNQHRNADVEATVASWIRFQDSLTGIERNYAAWRRKPNGAGEVPGDMNSRSLFIENTRIRSEDEDVMTGFSSLEITSDVSWQMTSENEAYPDPTNLNGALTTFTLTGPIHMAVSATLAPETFYLGHIAEVALYTTALDGESIDCMFRDVVNGGDIAVCRTPWDMSGRVYINDLVEAGYGTSERGMRRITVYGDATLHPDLGLVFDGNGDYATVETGQYADDGTYTLQYWFTRTDCTSGGNRTGHEFLYSHVGNQTMRDISTGPGGEMVGNPELDMMIVCAGAAGAAVSTLGQADAIRVVMRSNDDTTLTFDVPLDAWETRGGGPVTDLWIALTMTVGVEGDFAAIHFYLDGNELGTDVSASGFGMNPGGARIPDATNIALTGGGIVLAPMASLFGGSTLGPLAYLGVASGGLAIGQTFLGGMSGLAIYRQPIEPLDAACSFEYGESIHMLSAPTPAPGSGSGVAWACDNTPGMVVETLGWDCPTAFSMLAAMGGCDYDLSILAPTLPSPTFLRDACPVSCDNCPDPPATGCVIGADDADGILASGVLPLDCATMISLIMQTTVEAACGTDGTDGMDLSAVAMIYAAVPAFDPTVMIADACMATCGTCMADTDGSMTAPPDSPVQPVVETLTTALAGGGYTTYQLALEGNTALASNVYALYGDASNGGPALTMPPAYQVGAPFGADIAGVNPAFFAFMADAQYDSWITVGFTESDTTNAISSIGLNFTTWTETTPLTTSDGSIFWMTPTDGPDFATTPVVVIAQLTVATGTSFDAMVSVQGAAASGVLGDTWTAEGVTFRV